MNRIAIADVDCQRDVINRQCDVNPIALVVDQLALAPDDQLGHRVFSC